MALALTLNGKNRNANVHLTSARRRIRVALHYARVAFASRFPLRRHPLRTVLVPRVGLRRGCITRWRRSGSRYALTLIRVLINLLI